MCTDVHIKISRGRGKIDSPFTPKKKWKTTRRRRNRASRREIGEQTNKSFKVQSLA